MELRISWFLIMSLFFHLGHCWDNDELEIFDLVEEINSNFYTLLGVPQDAEGAEIRKAYRRLSLVLHPDKNDAVDAEIKFRQLVAVYDVLRDPKKRLLYNDVLANGLPDWKHAIYYYRRVRKMGLAEMSIILFVIITVGQYIVAWAAYAERKFTFEQFMDMKLKKLQKKQKKGKYDGPLPESIAVDIPKPSVWNTLPIQIPRFIWFVVTGAPKSVRFVRAYWAERKRRQEEEEMWSEEEEVVEEVRQPRRRKTKFTPPEFTEASNDLAQYEAENAREIHDRAAAEPAAPVISGGLWTDDDLVELIRLIKKYPPGTSARWERIANSMNRTVTEVTHMARKVKDDGYRVGKTEEEMAAEAEKAEVKKVKTRGGKLGVEGEEGDGSNWGQSQQKALEVALIKFPKGASGERWEKIAKCVPGKTKEECMIRYKQLVELVKKRKENGEVCQDDA